MKRWGLALGYKNYPALGVAGDAGSNEVGRRFRTAHRSEAEPNCGIGKFVQRSGHAASWPEQLRDTETHRTPNSRGAGC